MKSDSDTKQTCARFLALLSRFTEAVSSLKGHAQLSCNREFLHTMADVAHELYDSSIEVLNCHSEEARAVGRSVKDIFLRPLAKQGERSVTIAHATHSFSKQDPHPKESELALLLREYVIHPESTGRFIRELELLATDLELVLKAG
ncbi:MAG: hypothetical protein OXF02_05755 [Simkaniaceae bacterium]|nr:hypothetical protein [Simkaniaceae bacterium]